MRLLINGGGSGEQTALTNKKFKELLNGDTRPLLYLPLAMTKFSLDSCYEWITKELESIGLSKIEMIRSIEEFEQKDFNNYCAIFIGGGNTYFLLSLLKSNNSFNKLKEYMKNDGIVYGGSAGAVILGNDIDTIKLMDQNEVGLEDTHGLDCINDFSIYPHYTNKSEEFEQEVTKYLKEFEKSQVIALSEATTIYLNDGKYEIIGKEPIYIFSYGEKIKLNIDSATKIQEFNNLKTLDELMDFMNKNIIYGWVSKNDELHFENLKNFRENYRISNIEKTLKNGLGTCLEQVKLTKYFCDKHGLENKIFCHRVYETESKNETEVKMHVLIFIKYNNEWYYFERANSLKRGIYKCETINKKLKDIMLEYENKEIRMLTEINDIPEGLNFSEFNQYINGFPEYNFEKIKECLTLCQHSENI